MINGQLLDHVIEQKFIVLNKLKEMQAQYPDGLRPKELAILCDIPDPSVRRILGAFLKNGTVYGERITRNCSMFKVVS